MSQDPPQVAPTHGRDDEISERRIELPERYRDLGAFARGGWGELRRALDRTLDRVVVFKILADDPKLSARDRARFFNEATITASLEHPGVVPIHDRGLLPDGRPWFTMKEVRGVTLEAAIRSDETVRTDAARLRRLIDVFARVCETV